MKKIYYLLVCLFILQSAFATREEQTFDVPLQELAEYDECGSLYGWNIPDSGYSSFNLFLSR